MLFTYGSRESQFIMKRCQLWGRVSREQVLQPYLRDILEILVVWDDTPHRTAFTHQVLASWCSGVVSSGPVISIVTEFFNL